MAEYGKSYESEESTTKQSSNAKPPETVIVVPDDLIVEFLAQHGVEAKPPASNSAAKNAFMGAAVGANPLVGGMLHIANNQLKGGAQSEWILWKQWALSHADWPAFWQPHHDRLRAQQETPSQGITSQPQKESLQYGMPGPSKAQKPAPLYNKPAGLLIALAGGFIGGPAGLIISPLVLWLLGLKGPKIIKDKNGKEIVIGVWAQWLASGVVLAPLLAGVTGLLLPSPDQKQQSSDPLEKTDQPFAPGVPGRQASEVCNTTTPECRHWTALAIRCEENMRRRDEGYLGQFDRNYCSEMESYREQVTGIAVSSDSGAYSF
jgi:hypothetical protein